MTAKICSVLFVASIFYGVYYATSLPVVAIDQNGNCAWVVDGSIEKKVCPLEMPERYTTEYVWIE